MLANHITRIIGAVTSKFAFILECEKAGFGRLSVFEVLLTGIRDSDAVKYFLKVKEMGAAAGLFVGLILACLNFQAAAQHEKAFSVMGDVTYSGLDALPWHTRIHIYIADTTSESGLIAEKTIITEGEQIPIDFSFIIPRSAMRADHRYTICADVSILDKPKFSCNLPIVLHPQRRVDRVKILLKRLP
jgi:uncharacterized lipoprotein YbaY